MRGTGRVLVSDLGSYVGLQEVETSCGQSVCEMLVGHAVEMPDGQLCRKDWGTLRVLGQK